MATYTIKNPTDWANAFLGALGVPDTKTNVSNVVGWEALEGGNWHNTAKYNPLNTTQEAPGSTNFATGRTGSGIQAYPNWQEGLDATVQTLQNGSASYNYSQILLDLNTSQPWSDFSNALKQSSWDGSGHYAGLSGTTIPGLAVPGAGNPDSQSYGTGQVATQQSGAAADSPSKAKGSKDLQGIGGVLQALDAAYNPDTNSRIAGIIPNVPNDINATLVEIATRGLSSVLFIFIIAMGIKSLTSGSGGGGGTSNVLEFVNNAQKTNLSAERVRASEVKEQGVQARHESSLASKERVASTPRTSHIYHHTAKPKVQVKLIDKEAYVNGAK